MRGRIERGRDATSWLSAASRRRERAEIVAHAQDWGWRRFGSAFEEAEGAFVPISALGQWQSWHCSEPRPEQITRFCGFLGRIIHSDPTANLRLAIRENPKLPGRRLGIGTSWYLTVIRGIGRYRTNACAAPPTGLPALSRGLPLGMDRGLGFVRENKTLAVPANAAQN